MNEIAIVKDEEHELPIPSIWRPVFSQIVNALVKGEYRLGEGVESVAPVSEETASHIQAYIEDYGESLIQLPEDTWQTSTCIWMGSHWDVLLDLWTLGEGRSDLVLSAKVSEIDDGHIVEIHMVYVP